MKLSHGDPGALTCYCSSHVPKPGPSLNKINFVTCHLASLPSPFLAIDLWAVFLSAPQKQRSPVIKLSDSWGSGALSYTQAPAGCTGVRQELEGICMWREEVSKADSVVRDKVNREV